MCKAAPEGATINVNPVSFCLLWEEVVADLLVGELVLVEAPRPAWRLGPLGHRTERVAVRRVHLLGPRPSDGSEVSDHPYNTGWPQLFEARFRWLRFGSSASRIGQTKEQTKSVSNHHGLVTLYDVHTIFVISDPLPPLFESANLIPPPSHLYSSSSSSSERL